MIDSFSRPFHGLVREALLVPAMNRWAIISRPLSADWDNTFLCRAGQQIVQLGSVPTLREFLCAPLQPFAYFAVKTLQKQLTAKSAKHAKITQRVELSTLSSAVVFLT